jgi:hypothetical protein
MYLDVRVWTREMEAQARQMQKDYQILTDPAVLKVTVKEYPT